MPNYVDIVFDCVPLASVAQLRPPLDASPQFRDRYERVAQAIATHGSERTYWLDNAHATFHLANSEVAGAIRFQFEGVSKTDASDAKTESVHINATQISNTCVDISSDAHDWLVKQLEQAVVVEFDHYIAAGKLPSPADDVVSI